MLEEEIRLKDQRMERVRPRRRPHYRAVERLAILELRAARGWSRRQTAKRFLLQPATLGEWAKCVDEGGEHALLQTPEPVNRFSEFVRHVVKRLKVLCPTMGKKRIAQTLSRAGLVLGVSTVGRMLKERDRPTPEPAKSAAVSSIELASFVRDNVPGGRSGLRAHATEKSPDVDRLESGSDSVVHRRYVYGLNAGLYPFEQ